MGRTILINAFHHCADDSAVVDALLEQGVEVGHFALSSSPTLNRCYLMKLAKTPKSSLISCISAVSSEVKVVRCAINPSRDTFAPAGQIRRKERAESMELKSDSRLSSSPQKHSVVRGYAVTQRPISVVRTCTLLILRSTTLRRFGNSDFLDICV